ncbi:MAG: thioesterase family protein [Planctomycetota bacterium]
MPTADLFRHSISFRVEYHETDGQRRVHHSNFINYFERARVEMLRAAGLSYRQFEDDGRLLVVTEMNLRYFGSAEFDDLLTVNVEATDVRKVRIRHCYSVTRGDELITEGDSVIACVDRNGKPTKLPEIFWKTWRERNDS